MWPHEPKLVRRDQDGRNKRKERKTGKGKKEKREENKSQTPPRPAANACNSHFHGSGSTLNPTLNSQILAPKAHKVSRDQGDNKDSIQVN